MHVMDKNNFDTEGKAKLHYDLLPGFVFIVVSVLGLFGCRHDHMPSLSTGGRDYVQVNLVADTAGFGAARIDTNLANPWGISMGRTGIFWIACNNTGKTVVYDEEGNEELPAVAIPYHGRRNGSSPTGSIFNPTSGFVVNGKAARFIYCTEDGTIDAWVAGDSTITVADRSTSGAIYKGLAMANDGTGDLIYAANFFSGKIDVFDPAFNYLAPRAFTDPGIPLGYAPFNIRTISGKLYVAYAKQKAHSRDDEKGPGNGYVSIFDPKGTLIKRFASQGALNSPWGIIQPPKAFGQDTNVIFIANFGDGRINVYDTSGVLKGPLGYEGAPITINGLWDIAFHPSSNERLYFAAGPGEERYGLFGYLKLK